MEPEKGVRRLALNIWGDREIARVDGQRLSEKARAEHLRGKGAAVDLWN